MIITCASPPPLNWTAGWTVTNLVFYAQSSCMNKWFIKTCIANVILESTPMPNSTFTHTHSNSLLTNFRQNLHMKVMDSPKPSSPIRVMDPRSSRMVISSGRLWFTENWAWTSMSLLQKNISSISFMQLVTSEFHHVVPNVNWSLVVALNTDTWHPASTSYKYCISQSKTKFTSSQVKI